MAATIGIKIANGEFYPLLGENSAIRKKLILTTVHDNQHGMQIDLYRSVAKSMTDAQYIGSLVVENIKSARKGEPSIQMIVSSTIEGDITSEVIDLDKTKDEPNVLSVSLKTLDGTDRSPGIQDFELDSNESSSGSRKRTRKTVVKEKRKIPASIFVAAGIILILGLLAAWLLFLGGIDTVSNHLAKYKANIEKIAKPEPVKKVEPVKQEEPVKAPEPVKVEEPVKPVEPPAPPPEPVPVIAAPAEPPAPKPVVTKTRPPAPVLSYKVPSVIPKGGVSYKIRWGDTLWDIAAAFYRNPWLYPRIARFNNIKNPNLIISGRTIKIPPRN